MNTKQIVAAAAAVCCVTGTVMAQVAAPKATAKPVADSSSAYLKAGTVEYGLNGGYSLFHTDRAAGENQVSILTAMGEVNYFVIDNLSVGLNGDFTWLRGEGSSGSIVGGGVANAKLAYAELVARYHFPVCRDRLIPYVGASVGAGEAWVNVRADGAGTTTTYDGAMTDWGLQGGFKVPLNENVMFDMCLKYSQIQLPGGLHTDLSATQILFGFKLKM